VIISLALNSTGASKARLLEYKVYSGNVKKVLASYWDKSEAIICFFSIPVTVRLISPHLKGKSKDPIVISVDEATNYEIPIIGAHKKGQYSANELAKKIAAQIKATPIITTATDSLNISALDGFNSFEVDGPLAKITSQLTKKKTVKIINPMKWPTPLSLKTSPDGIEILISDQIQPEFEGVILRPKSLVVAIGCSTNCEFEEIDELLQMQLELHNLSIKSLGYLASINRRKNHPAILKLIEKYNLSSVFYSESELDAVKVANPSKTVKHFVNTSSVAEAAAIKFSSAAPIIPKTKSKSATLAISRLKKPRGNLYIVGIGPGDINHMTHQALAKIRHADAVIGYKKYLEYCGDLLGPNHKVYTYKIGEEQSRVTKAIELARKGYTAAIISSGDPGVYAMGSLVLENLPIAPDFNIEIIPGITAALSSSARLGAPLSLDFATISLSDIHVDMDTILKRLELLLRSGVTVCIYNPRSNTRSAPFEKALEIIRDIRGDKCLIGLVKNAFRKDEFYRISHLDEINSEDIDMNTTLVINSPLAYLKNGYIISPRYVK
jgi:cobalt-precorrin 5A hydrolase/precorrin-3B C17-methyltransferase